MTNDDKANGMQVYTDSLNEIKTFIQSVNDIDKVKQLSCRMIAGYEKLLDQRKGLIKILDKDNHFRNFDYYDDIVLVSETLGIEPKTYNYNDFGKDDINNLKPQ